MGCLRNIYHRAGSRRFVPPGLPRPPGPAQGDAVRRLSRPGGSEHRNGVSEGEVAHEAAFQAERLTLVSAIQSTFVGGLLRAKLGGLRNWGWGKNQFGKNRNHTSSGPGGGAGGGDACGDYSATQVNFLWLKPVLQLEKPLFAEAGFAFGETRSFGGIPQIRPHRYRLEPESIVLRASKLVCRSQITD